MSAEACESLAARVKPGRGSPVGAGPIPSLRLWRAEVTVTFGGIVAVPGLQYQLVALIIVCSAESH